MNIIRITLSVLICAASLANLTVMFLGTVFGPLGFFPNDSSFDRLLFLGGGMVWMSISYVGYIIGYLFAREFHTTKVRWLTKVLVARNAGIDFGLLFIAGMAVMLYLFIIHPTNSV